MKTALLAVFGAANTITFGLFFLFVHRKSLMRGPSMASKEL